MYNPNLTDNEWRILVADMTTRLAFGGQVTDDQMTIADILCWATLKASEPGKCQERGCEAPVVPFGYCFVDGVLCADHVCIMNHHRLDPCVSRVTQ